jgi:hypothetical protein
LNQEGILEKGVKEVKVKRDGRRGESVLTRRIRRKEGK